MKDGKVDALRPTEVGHETAGKYNRADRLDGERAHDDAQYERARARAVFASEGLLDRALLIHAEISPPDHEKNDSDEGRKPQSARLNEQENDGLSEPAPMHGGIHHHEPRYAGSRCGGEKRVEIGRRTVLRRKRQYQKNTSDQDDQKIPQGEILPDAHLFLDFFRKFHV